MKDNCKKIIGITAKIMKRIFNVFFVIVVIYYGITAVFDLAIYPFVTGKSSKLFQNIRYVFVHEAKIAEEDPVKMATEAVSVSIQDLAKTIWENSIEAEKKYYGKFLRLTGTVRSIRKDISVDGVSSYYVNLVYDPDKLSSINDVRIYPRKKEVHKLDSLVIGQTVTIVGKCIENEWWNTMEIKDAFFE